MADFITSCQQITIEMKNINNEEVENKKAKNIESKIIVSTNAQNLKEVDKTSYVRIYFFVNLDGNESSCYEYDPFKCDKFIMKNDKVSFVFEKTINNKYRQTISFSISNKDDDDDDDDDGDDDNAKYSLKNCLSDLNKKRFK